MPDPTDLLAVARLLATHHTPAPPSDGQLRRAVSTAYYAVFHTVLRAAADRFTGPGGQTTAGYDVLYRGFDHRNMRTVCEALQVSTLRARFQRSLRRTSVSQDMQVFAGAFLVLQAARHEADYDPSAAFTSSSTTSLVDAAEAAIGAFHRVPPQERADVLALMLVRLRD